MSRIDDTSSSPTNTKDLEELRQIAVKSAFDSQKLEDIEKAANISKLLAEREKSVVDVKTGPVAVRIEMLKSWATLLVPLLTVATLCVTVGMQWAQLKATREANEDLKWRETVKMVLEQVSRPSSSGRGPTGFSAASSPPDPVMAATLLKSYIGDKRYGKDAVDLSFVVLSRLPSDVFQDLFFSMKIAATWDNLDRIVALNRNLSSKFYAMDSELRNIRQELRQNKGQPGEGSIQALKKQEDQYSNYYDESLRELNFTSEKIAEIMRIQRPDRKELSLDFGRTYLRRTDLSGLDLSSANLKGAKVEEVKLKDTLLKGIRRDQVQDSVWLDTNWWDAKEISPDLLTHLLEEYYPYHGTYEYTDKPPASDEYGKKVQDLCKKAGVPPPGKLKYGSPPAKARK